MGYFCVGLTGREISRILAVRIETVAYNGID
jgi:hypothetical protein